MSESTEPRPAEGDALIVSPDTQRAQRIPPGQSETRKWPVLDAFGPPQVDLERWALRVFGLVGKPVQWNWEDFQTLPRVRVLSDFHCVTRWSRLDNTWAGVPVRALLEAAGGAMPEARFVVAHGLDHGWTTNLPLEEFLGEDVLVATHHDGVPLTGEHGAPARLVVPRLYAWKSAKWLTGLEFVAEDAPGFWERNGYHNTGDPWREERYNRGW